MNRRIKFPLIVSTFVLVIVATAVLSFKAGEKTGIGKAAWIRGAESRMYLKFLEQKRLDDLQFVFEEGMWLSVFYIDDFVHSPFAKSSDKEAARSILAEIAKHFRENPKTIESPTALNLAEEVQSGIDGELESETLPNEEKEVLDKLGNASHDVFKSLGAGFDDMLQKAYERDLLIKEIVKKY